MDVLLERTGSNYTGYWYTAESKGHTKPELCLAVSVLMQTLDAWLNVTGATVSEEVISKGHCKLRFTGSGCGTAFNVVHCGLARLANTNPDEIHLTVKKK